MNIYESKVIFVSIVSLMITGSSVQKSQTEYYKRSFKVSAESSWNKMADSVNPANLFSCHVYNSYIWYLLLYLVLSMFYTGPDIT